MVFENWVYGEFDESLNEIYGLDYGFYPDPTALVKCAIDKKRMRLYVKQLVYEQKLTTDQLDLRVPKQNKLVVCDNSEPRLTSELVSKGHNMRPVTKFNDSIKAGIDMMSQYSIIVDPDSIDIGKELNNYVWNDRKSSTPIDDWNHAIDAIRYAVMEYENLKNTTKAGSFKMPKERPAGFKTRKKFM